MRIQFSFSTFLLLIVLLTPVDTHAQRLELPRRHDKPPGPALSAEDAVKRMVVPEGFSVEIVAKEPDVVNPVGMCIDEKGRFWITESFEYPRKEPGPGKDRIKVLEDTDGDGKIDKTTIFAEGLNIPSGINVGYGGVWVANAPDILFMQDTDGDLKADKIETIVSGFGRDDTHELPNSLTWGPDGWLYGLNGVFNYCDVKYAKENPNYDEKHPGWKFTCAMFRIHPRTKEFQIFAEGTSNPWGIAFNGDGEAFVSACVIDHLWHITETAYYIRQGGPYPPHTWPMRSIVNHHHQKAAYCGITWFDSEAYPEEYRDVLYMGNIHGGCINADIATRKGATYEGKPHPGFPAPKDAFKYETVRKIGEGDNAKLADFLTANDAWFMPVVQKVGPDGCLYILDWYDRYHCYQDANADPAGIEREKGRLYRVVYKGHKNKKAEDLGALNDDQLIARLDDSNVYVRSTAQRLLRERDNPATAEKLTKLVETKTDNFDRHQRSALFALAGFTLHRDFDDNRAGNLARLLMKAEDPFARTWGLRINQQHLKRIKTSDPHELEVSDHAMAGLEDEDPIVRLQGAILTSRIVQQGPPSVRFEQIVVPVMCQSQNDLHLLNSLWVTCQAMDDTTPGSAGLALKQLMQHPADYSPALIEVSKRLIAKELSNKRLDNLVETLKLMNNMKSPPPIGAFILSSLIDKVRNGEITGDQLEALKTQLATAFKDQPPQQQLLVSSMIPLQALLGDVEAIQQVSKSFNDTQAAQGIRLDALKTLVAAKAPHIISNVGDAIGGTSAPKEFRIAVIEALGGVDNPEVPKFLLDNYPVWESDVKPRVIEVLTQRDAWSAALLKEVQNKNIPTTAINLNQLQRINSFKYEEVQKLLAATYGQIRADQRSDRQQVIVSQTDFLNKNPGDPHQGIAVFKKVCGQCHKIYGEGSEVGPDITRNGRSNWNQLLQNVFDPSAVIGPGYQARQLATVDGRVLTGLPVEESEDRVVLKVQGGKLETIPRDQIEQYKVSELSMMPEQLEKQITPQELADLFAYLALDKPPIDPEAKILSGAPEQKLK